MASVMVIVSKAAFKNDVVTAEGKQGELGDVCPIPHYRSRHKSIDTLQEGGALFLVTVRPPEQLWLCAVLESPRALSDGWYGEPNVVPITDISALRDKIKFTSGKGMSQKAGALAMSLQTPRALTDEDVALIRGAYGGSAAVAAAADDPLPDGEEAELLRAVVEAPSDYAPRIVYADWLSERGDPRGEMIALACKLRSGDIYFSEREAARARVGQLLRAHESRWAGEMGLPDGTVSRRHWSAGFVESIEATSASSFLRVANAAMARTPILRMSLLDITAGQLEQLVSAPWAARLQGLKLLGDSGEKIAEILAGAPSLAKLERLNLCSMELSPDAAEALASSSHLRNLRRLALTANAIGDEGVAALARSEVLARCEVLYLAANEITDDGVRELAASPYLKSLRELGLGNNEDISAKGLDAMLQSTAMPQLRRVELDATAIPWKRQKDAHARWASVRF